MASPIEEIKARIDIVDFLRGYLDLKPAGKNLRANCPFHKERTPSFMVSPDRQIWHCFGCNEGGDIFKFIMKYDNLEFYEALQVLAEKAGIELRKVSPSDQREFGVLYDINRIAVEFFKRELEVSAVAQTYLSSRCLTKESLENFQVGFAPNNFEALTLHLINAGFDVKDLVRSGVTVRSESGKYFDRFRGRIMFPLWNTFGKTVGFSGRIMPEFETEETAKYLNSPETPIFSKSRVLYGLTQAKEAIREVGFALLVEGMMDVITSHQDGVKNTIGISGTALTPDQLKILHRHTNRIVLNLDNDSAGKQATERSIDLAHENDFEVRVLNLGDLAKEKGLAIKDTADLVKAKPGLLKELVTKSTLGMEYYFGEYLKNDDSSNRKNNIRVILQKIKKVMSAIERGFWLRKLSDETEVRETDLIEEMEKMTVQNVSLPKKIDTPSNLGDIKLTRRELIAERLLGIASLNDEWKQRALSVKQFLPLKYQEVLLCLSGERNPEDEELINLVNIISLQAAAGQTQGGPEEDEIEALLRNLELESLYEKREELRRLIKKQEDIDGNAVLDNISEFQEVSKAIENLKNKKTL